MFMNHWDIEEAMYKHRGHPVLARATRFLHRFMEVVDDNSDGWAYWRSATKAAQKLMELISDPATATEEKLKKAVTPIKSLCTRHKLTCPEV